VAVAARAAGRDLAPFVRRLWVEDVAGAESLRRSTGPRLLVDLADPGRVLIVGAGAIPADSLPAAGVRRCGADLTPAGLPAFTSTAASAFAHRIEDAGPHLRWSATWPARLAATSSSDDTLEVLQQLLRSVRRRRYVVDARLAQATRWLEADPRIPVAALARETGLSDSGFRRLFARGTGMSPRAYRALARAVAPD
jgi:AraC-like DNA-binding protein